jgi:hypothetical protein
VVTPEARYSIPTADGLAYYVQLSEGVYRVEEKEYRECVPGRPVTVVVVGHEIVSTKGADDVLDR